MNRRLLEVAAGSAHGRSSAPAIQSVSMPHQPAEDDPELDQCRLEAERLAQLAPEVQRQVLAIIRSPADNPRLPKSDREAGATRRASWT